MWFEKRTHHAHLIALIDPPTVHLYWFAQQYNRHVPFSINAYHAYRIPGLDLAPYMLTNTTSVAQSLRHFLAQYQPKSTFFTFIITPPALFEKFVTTTKSHPDRADMLAHFPPGMTGQYHYVCPQPDESFLFYLCAIPSYLRAQYQMCALSAHVDLVSLCPYSLGFFHTYRHIQGAAFRTSKLSVDMEQKKSPASLVSPALLTHIIGNTMVQENSHHLTAAFGIYVAQKDSL
jgi:hypothetical protein